MYLNKRLILLFFIAFSLRLTYFLSVLVLNSEEGFLSKDSFGYLKIAENLISELSFSMHDNTAITNHTRTPTYPLFLSILSFIGLKTIGIAFIQILISSLTTITTYLLAFKLSKNRMIALIAFLFIAIDVPSIYFSTAILTETLFTFLLLQSIYQMVNYIYETKSNFLFISSIYLGLAIYCRPIGFYLIPVLLAFLLFKYRIKIRQILLFAAIPLTLSFTWIVRNKVVFDNYFFSSISSVNLYFFTTGYIMSDVENISFYEAHDKLRTEALNHYDWENNNNDVKIFVNYFNQKAFNTIKKHPFLFLKHSTKNFIYFFAKPLRSYIDLALNLNKKNGFKNTSFFTIAIVIIQFIILMILYLGIIKGILMKHYNHPTWTLFVIIVVYFAITSSIAADTDARFRVPIIPYLSILSALGINYFINCIPFSNILKKV